MRSPLALALLPCLAACAATSDKYPSLAVRDVERAEGKFEPVEAEPMAVPEVETPRGPLSDQLATLAAASAASHTAFTAAAPRAARLAAAAAGSAIGSDAWASAQVALSDLDSARSQTAIHLADLDTLMVSGAVQAQDITAIEAVRQQVLADIRIEDETLARLRARVR